MLCAQPQRLITYSLWRIRPRRRKLCEIPSPIYACIYYIYNIYMCVYNIRPTLGERSIWGGGSRDRKTNNNNTRNFDIVHSRITERRIRKISRGFRYLYIMLYNIVQRFVIYIYTYTLACI